MDQQRQRFRGNLRRALYREEVPAEPAHHTQHHQHAQTASVPNQSVQSYKTGFFFGRRWLLIVILVLLLGIGLLAYGYIHTKNQLEAAKNPSNSGKTEIQQIQNQISRAVSLPNETPTLATVSDATKLKSQVFFKDAQNGDKVLIYQHAGTAILYRPSTKKVIEYAPVNLGNNQ